MIYIYICLFNIRVAVSCYTASSSVRDTHIDAYESNKDTYMYKEVRNGQTVNPITSDL